MSCQPNPRRSALARKAGWFLAFSLVSVVLMAASAPECARTEDMPLSPAATLGPTGDAGACVNQCVEEANALRFQERDRFKSAIQGCSSEDCRSEEAALHVSIMQTITAEQRVCMSSCHNQGGGSGGN